MKSTVLFLTIVLLSFETFSQTCLPNGISFNTQAQIDNFHINYPNCKEIEGAVLIQSGNDIVNLYGLNGVRSIGGSLTIKGNNELVNLIGFDSLTSIGGNLNIGDSANFGYGNATMTDLFGLDNLTYIGGNLNISSNPLLNNLAGLAKLTFLGGSLQIADNGSLSTLDGLNSLTSIPGGLFISYNYYLIDSDGLKNLMVVGGSASISHNNFLSTLSGLTGLKSIGGGLEISYNINLESLSGLNNLNYIGGDLWIDYNSALNTLIGLDSIDPGSINNLNIFGNSSLSNCAVQSICDYLANPNGITNIQNNSPGCNNPIEVEAECASISVEKLTNDGSFLIYPNPASNFIVIESLKALSQFNFTVLNINSQEIIRCQLTERISVVNISNLTNGVYFGSITNQYGVQISKFIIIKT